MLAARYVVAERLPLTFEMQMSSPLPHIYLVADNLDAALAAGEDLLKHTLVWDTGLASDGKEIAKKREEQRSQIERVQTLEQILIARILKTRDRAQDIAKEDSRFASVVRLFNSGTQQLAETVPEFGAQHSPDFDNGGSIVAYLRSRGLLPKDQAGPNLGQKFQISEEFLVARRFRLGTLLDLIATFLDTLEVHYELFSDAPETEFPDTYSTESSPLMPPPLQEKNNG